MYYSLQMTHKMKRKTSSEKNNGIKSGSGDNGLACELSPVIHYWSLALGS